MTGSQPPGPQFLTQESRVATITCLHRQLCESFEEFSQPPASPGYDPRLEPAFLHSVVDQLVEEVSLLTTELELDEHGELFERVGHNGAVQQQHVRPNSMTALIDRYSSLIDSVRVAARAATDAKDWALTNICSELAQRFEESLWTMVVSVHDHWSKRHAAVAV